jgi:hypothetical protein
MNRALAVLALLASLACASEALAGNVITQWNFNTTGSNNSPAPSTGSGTATVLGMNNSYTFSSGNTITGSGTFIPGTIEASGSVAAADVTNTSGDPSGNANAWRVRGPATDMGSGTITGNGWALQAPQDSQGAQFSASTVGYNSIRVSFDWFTTTQGVKNMQEQYTLDGSTWHNINSPLTAVSNGWAPTQTIDLSGISGANNDPNFGIRLVSVYDNTLQFPNYGSADGGQAGYYNNNSGNWRFTAVTFTGNAVPEPSTLTLSLIGCGVAGLIVWRRRGMVR